MTKEPEYEVTLSTDIHNLTLNQKINAIMQEVGIIKKSGYNESQHYHYVREADLAETMQKLFTKYRINCFPRIEAIKTESITKKDRNGNDRIANRTVVEVSYTLVNSDKPEEKQMTSSAGEGEDSSDKATPKAMTNAKKYFYLQTFHLGSDDDPEKDDALMSIKGDVQQSPKPTQPFPSSQNKSKDFGSYPDKPAKGHETIDPNTYAYAWAVPYDSDLYKSLRQDGYVYHGKKQGGDGLWYGNHLMTGPKEGLNRYLKKGQRPNGQQNQITFEQDSLPDEYNV